METKKEYFAVVDTETGGLNNQDHELLEIGAVVYDYSGNCVDEFERVIACPALSPDQVVGPAKKKVNLTALKINHITDRLTEATHPLEAAREFALWSIDAVNKYNPTLVGQNLQFDTGFINPFMEQHGFSGWLELFHYHRIDTVPIALVLKKVGLLKSDRVSLVNLSKEFNVEHTSAHSALSDAHATAKVYLAMLARLKGIVQAATDDEKSIPNHPDV